MRLTEMLRSRPAQVLLAAVGLAIFVQLLASVVGTGINDYTLNFRAVTLRWLNGESRLFDAGGLGYYNLPWSVWLFVPTTWFSPAVGQALVNTLSLIGVMSALWVFGTGVSFWLRLLAAAPFWVFMLMLAGNLDGVVLLGFCLSWWAAANRRPWWLAAALWLASLKVVSVVPLLPFVAALTWHWRMADKFKAVSALLLSLALSFPMFGWDWPLRYVQAYKILPPFTFPIVTSWKLGEQLDLPLLLVAAAAGLIALISIRVISKQGVSHETFALATTGWMLVTPYALDIHYVLLVPAYLVMARRLPAVAVLAYLASFLPLLRIGLGFGVIGIDLLYPLLLWCGALYILAARRAASAAPAAARPAVPL